MEEPHLFTMKEVCEKTGLTYETLKYYCREGLIPDIVRSSGNARLFPQEAIDWIRHIKALRKSRLPISEIRRYASLVQQEESSLEERVELLTRQKGVLLQEEKELQESIQSIDERLESLEHILKGQKPYRNVFSHRTVLLSDQEPENNKKPD